MPAADCIKELKEVFGEDLSDAQLDEILDLLDRRARTKRGNDPHLGEQEAIMAAAEDLAAEKRLAALIEKRNRLINRTRELKRQSFYESTDAQPLHAIRALNVGREGKAYGLARSVDAQYKGLSGQMVGALVRDLKKEGVFDVIRRADKTFERDVAVEMSIYNGATELEPTGNTHAAKTAEILARHQEAGRVMQNKAGAFIRKLPGYVTRQNWDQMRIQKVDFEEFKKDFEQTLDPRTFDDVDDTDAFLRSVYDNLYSGNHMKANGESDWLGGFKGPGNLAKKVSSERTLHFKNPDEWLRMNQKYGRTSVFESVVNGIDFAARNTALLRNWGTNPDAAFRADLEKASMQAREAGGKQARNAKWNERLADSEMRQLTNSIHVPGDIRLARVVGSITAVQSMSKLGGVVLSALGDITFRVATLRHSGVSLFEGYGRMLDGISGTNSEKREVGDLLGAGLQGVMGGVFQRFTSVDNVPGAMSKMMDTYFKINGLTAWTDAMGRGTAMMLSRNLARQIKAKRGFGDLNGRLQSTLRRFGIGEEEWNLLSQTDLRVADGEDFLLTDAVRGLDDDTIRGSMGKPDASARAVEEVRDDLELSLTTYYSDQTREALTFAGAGENALMTQGMDDGTPMGAALKLMMQFKTFPITFVRRHLNREFRRDGVDKAGIAHLIVGSTILGYVAMNAKEIAKGREPRVPETKEEAYDVTRAAMLQGGGLGIYGDFLLGETNRYGKGLVATAMGPTASTIDDLNSVFETAKGGEVPTSETFRAAQGITPGQNLFYTRLAMDYLVLWGLQEAMNPGYLRRTERRIQRENNQDFWLPPTSGD